MKLDVKKLWSRPISGRQAVAVNLRFSRIANEDALFLAALWGLSRREAIERALIIVRQGVEVGQVERS